MYFLALFPKLRPKNSWLFFFPPSLKKELWRSYCSATEEQTMLASLSQFSEYQQLQPGLYGKRRGYHQLPVVNSSRLEQDVTDQHKTKTIRFRSTDVKLSLGSLSNNERQQPEREKSNRVIKQKQYICACLVSISCTGIKQTCIVTPGSVQLFNNNLPKNHSPLLAVGSFVSDSSYCCVTNKQQQAQPASKLLIQR